MDDNTLKAEAFPERILGSSPKVLKREAFEAVRDARDVVTSAQERARQIIGDAERERDAIREQARQEGNDKSLAEWNAVLAQARHRADELAKGWEETMLRLSVRLAEKIIGEELKLHPETIVAIVREVLNGTRVGKHLTIQVNEGDAQQVRSRIDRLRESLGAATDVDIVASPSIRSGGCVVESELGIVDARLETQLKCLEEVLLRTVPSDQGN